MRNKLIIATIIYIILIMWFYPFKKEETKTPKFTYKNPSEIVVELSGEVTFPGTYIIYSEKRLIDILEFAAGFTESADLEKVNLSKIINRSSKIIIPKIETINDVPLSGSLVNLNEASIMQLLLIPNITETRAENIIIYRNNNGPFLNVEQLMNVKGIGSATYEKIYKYFIV